MLGGCITRWFRCGLVFRWRNDWLAGLQPFFIIIIIFNKNCRRAKQCWMSMWREWPEYPDSRTTFKACKNSYTGITYFKILGQPVFCFFVFLFFFFQISVSTCWNIHSTSIKITSKQKTIYLTNKSLFGRIFTFGFWQFSFSKIIYEMFSK